MNYGEHDAEFLTQLKQEAKKSDGIDAARDRNSMAIASAQQFLPPDVGQHTLR